MLRLCCGSTKEVLVLVLWSGVSIQPACFPQRSIRHLTEALGRNTNLHLQTISPQPKRYRPRPLCALRVRGALWECAFPVSDKSDECVFMLLAGIQSDGMEEPSSSSVVGSGSGSGARVNVCSPCISWTRVTRGFGVESGMTHRPPAVTGLEVGVCGCHACSHAPHTKQFGADCLLVSV